MAVPDLPLDVIPEILAYLPAVDGVPFPNLFGTYQPCSQAAALTCRAWLPLARENLFRTYAFNGLPGADGVDPILRVSQRTAYLREVYWDLEVMLSSTDRAEGAVKAGRELIQLTKDCDVSQIAIVPIDTAYTGITLVRLRNMPEVTECFRRVYWRFKGACVLYMDSSMRSIMELFSTAVELHISSLSCHQFPTAVSNTVPLDVHRIVRLEISDIRFSTGSTACKSIAAFTHLRQLGIGDIWLSSKPSKSEPVSLCKVPPIQLLRITSPLVTERANMLGHHTTYNYLFRWLGSQPHRVRLETCHLEDVAAPFDHMRLNSVHTLSFSLRTDPVDLSACVSLKTLRITSERLEHCTRFSCVELVIFTLNSIPRDSQLESLRLELILPPADQWTALRAALDRPCFQCIPEFVLVVNDMKARTNWQDLNIFADIHGFRRRLKRYDLATDDTFDEKLTDLLERIQL